MKAWMKLLMVLVLVFPVLIFPVSCSKEMVQSDTKPVARSELPAPEETEAAAAAPRVESTAPAPEAAEAGFENRNIYFEYDSAKISEQAQLVLTRQARYLRANPEVMMTIEGHCDERGTEAYNMALGDRRAESARNFLVDMGIDADRLRTVSYGEGRPVALNHDEAAWARNRRARFVVQ